MLPSPSSPPIFSSPSISPESGVSIFPSPLYLTSLKFSHLTDSPAASILLELIFLADSSDRFFHFTITDDEISLLLDFESLSRFPLGILSQSPGVWRAIRILEGPEILDQPGVVSSLCAPLNSIGFELLYVSLHDSDIILVKENRVDEAFEILSRSLNFLIETK